MLEAKVAVVMIPIPRLDTGLNRDQGLRQVTDKVVMHITLKMGHMGAVNGVDHSAIGGMGLSMIGLPIKTDSTTERVSDEWRENTLAIIPFVVAGVDQFRDWFKDANTGLIIFCSFACIAHQVKVKM